MSTLQAVAVTVTEAQAKAIRKLAFASSKKSASELADDLFAQVVRGRFKAKAESAKQIAGEKWDTAAQIMGADKMPMPRAEYIKTYESEFAEVLRDL